MQISEAERLLGVQRRSFEQKGAPSLGLRKDRLTRLANLVRTRQGEFAEAIAGDFGGRSRFETALLETGVILSGIRHAQRRLSSWMAPSRRSVDPVFWPGAALVRHEPLGVVGVISPWNYPLQLALSPLTDIIAAGNNAILKPSEQTPAFSGLLAAAIAGTFSEEEVAVVTGGPDVAAAFSGLPFDHLVFTGSTEVGRKVQAAAAANLTPTTLELGGKSPVIVAPSADRSRAVRATSYGKFVNAGQTCIAPDFVLVPHGEEETFGRRVIEETERAYPGLGDDYASLISHRAGERLEAMLAEAEARGASVLRHPTPSPEKTRRFPPVVVLNPPDDCRLMREEIFGPVLPVLGYRTLDDAIIRARRGRHPLALYVFARSRAEQDKLLSAIPSGGVTVNGTLMHVAQEALPFGGVGHSGQGAYHGRTGFERFSHARAVFRAGPFDPTRLIAPPYGERVRRVLSVLLR